MKKLYGFALLIALLGCGKDGVVEKAQENLVIQAMTTGQWKVTSFTRSGNDVTSGFANYQFRFKTDLTVDAINSGSLEKTGSWNANADAQTITSSFSGVTDPLALLNGTWNITNTTWTSVNATMTVGAEVRSLRLDKL